MNAKDTKSKANEKSTNANARSSHPSVDAAASGAHDAVDWAAGAAGNATDSLSKQSHEIKATQERWIATARDYVQENPATSIGIAVAGGYFLSRIFSR